MNEVDKEQEEAFHCLAGVEIVDSFVQATDKLLGRFFSLLASPARNVIAANALGEQVDFGMDASRIVESHFCASTDAADGAEDDIERDYRLTRALIRDCEAQKLRVMPRKARERLDYLGRIDLIGHIEHIPNQSCAQRALLRITWAQWTLALWIPTMLDRDPAT